MKGILEFSLPEERENFDIAQKGLDYLCALDEMDNWLRSKIKYGNLPEEQEKIYQECRDKLFEFRSE